VEDALVFLLLHVRAKRKWPKDLRPTEDTHEHE
jgi:hypothetical protein